MAKAVFAGEFVPNKRYQSLRKRKLIGNIIRFIVLLILVIPMIFPLLWMITSALKSNSSILAIPPEWIPKEFHWENFTEGLSSIDFLPRFFNTLFITVMCIIGQVLSCTLVAYGLSRIRFPGRKFWFYFFVGGMMLPSMVGIFPVYRFWVKLGALNTYWPLIVPSFLGSPFYTFLLRQFFLGVPKSFDEAAKIDGAGHLRILFQVLVPIIKPAIICIVIMQFQASWNEYLQPLLYLIDDKKWTLSLAVASFASLYAVEWNKFMAADLIYMLPSLILFFACQKYFMQGLGSLTNTGIK